MKLFIALTLLSLSRPAYAVDDATLTAVLYLVQQHPHPLADDADALTEIADALYDAAQQYRVPALLLVSMAWFESHFRPDILRLKTVGKLGEQGLLQTGPHAVRDGRCDTSTLTGQAACGARWLALARDGCNGSIEQGLALYASGRTCHAEKSKRLLWRVNARLHLWRRLEGRFGR
jgi:hypothetical protein